jgi:hypothetical protein
MHLSRTSRADVRVLAATHPDLTRWMGKERGSDAPGAGGRTRGLNRFDRRWPSTPVNSPGASGSQSFARAHGVVTHSRLAAACGISGELPGENSRRSRARACSGTRDTVAALECSQFARQMGARVLRSPGSPPGSGVLGPHAAPWSCSRRTSRRAA